MWLESNASLIKIISCSNPRTVFVTMNGDVYVDNSNKDTVDKWPWNATSSVFIMNTTAYSDGLFVDTNGSVYYSSWNTNKVIKRSSNNGTVTITIVAGTGVSGNAATTLNQPRGIFVDISFNLYVADMNNNRIQLFRPGQMNATTLAGTGAPGTITLSGPTGVVLDADGYLFIVNFFANNIVGSGPNGFQCIAGCSGLSGSSSNELNYPFSLSFDSHGNLFVADRSNNRIQKFLLANNSCGKFY
jgi:tripartite motif-containing protein 71